MASLCAWRWWSHGLWVTSPKPHPHSQQNCCCIYKKNANLQEFAVDRCLQQRYPNKLCPIIKFVKTFKASCESNSSLIYRIVQALLDQKAKEEQLQLQGASTLEQIHRISRSIQYTPSLCPPQHQKLQMPTASQDSLGGQIKSIDKPMQHCLQFVFFISECTIMITQK